MAKKRYNKLINEETTHIGVVEITDAVAEEEVLETQATSATADAAEQMARVIEKLVEPKKVVTKEVDTMPKVDFDVWFVMRGSKIPPQHHKEIIKADFKGRGLGQCESMEDFDTALRKYGIKLA